MIIEGFEAKLVEDQSRMVSSLLLIQKEGGETYSCSCVENGYPIFNVVEKGAEIPPFIYAEDKHIFHALADALYKAGYGSVFQAGPIVAKQKAEDPKTGHLEDMRTILFKLLDLLDKTERIKGVKNEMEG